MKKLSQAAAVAALGLACAMPVMAQSSSTTATPSSTTSATTDSTTPSTAQMGAGPSEVRSERVDNDRDMGWIGLLGLAGLLGLRRKHNDHDRHDNLRTTPAR